MMVTNFADMIAEYDNVLKPEDCKKIIDKFEYDNIIKSVNGKMNHGRDPIEVANLVSKIIKEKKPKINYLVGGFLEKKITLKSLLPDKLFQRIIMKLYS